MVKHDNDAGSHEVGERMRGGEEEGGGGRGKGRGEGEGGEVV